MDERRSQATSPAHPFPASTTTLSGRARRILELTAALYSSSRESARRSPRPVAKSPRSMVSRTAWISGPYMESVPAFILRPFMSGGLWLPVIMIPPSTGRSCRPK